MKTLYFFSAKQVINLLSYCNQLKFEPRMNLLSLLFSGEIILILVNGSKWHTVQSDCGNLVYSLFYRIIFIRPSRLKVHQK